MKTEKLQQAIAFMGGSSYPKPTLTEYAQIKTDAEAELAVIVKENTAKDKQIAGLITAAKIGLSYAIEGCTEHYGESRTKTRKHRGWPQDHLDLIVSIEAAIALQAPTSKVLIDVEKLRKLADGFHGTDGIEIGLCPVCAKKERHDDNCWLNNALKEAKNA